MKRITVIILGVIAGALIVASYVGRVWNRSPDSEETATAIESGPSPGEALHPPNQETVLPTKQIQQATTEPQSTSTILPADIKPSNPYNIKLGSFLFRPELTVSDRYDNNIFATRDNEVNDSLLIIEPTLLFISNWDQHLVKFNIGSDLGRYDQHDSEDYDDFWAGLQGRYDVNKKTNIFGGLNYARDHEDRGTPEVVGTIPTTFDSNQVHAGFAQRSGNFKFRIGGTFEQLDFGDAGPINNDDRDRDISELGMRLNYLYTPNRELFAQVSRDVRNYKLSVDDSGFIRDSDGHRLAFGLKGRYSNRLSVEGYLGRIYQDFDDTRFRDVDTLDINARVQYLSSPGSRMSLVLDRSLEETTLQDASSYLNSRISMQSLRQLSSHNSVVAAFSVGFADYQEVALEERMFDARLDWRHSLSPELFIALSYRLLIKDSNQDIAVNNPANPQYAQDYVRQQVMLTLNTTLFDIDDPGFGKSFSREILNASKNNWRGCYLGGQVGHGTTHVRTAGIRGSSGTDYGEFGDGNSNSGLFAGYGTNLGRWYLGLEAEADQINQNMAHTKSKPISRTFNIDNEKSYAVNLRGGYTLNSGPLIYARIGKASAEFNTIFMLNNEPTNAVSKTYDVDGVRYGIGTDIPIGDNLFVRMDYNYTNYDSYIVDAVTTAEKFDPSDNQVHLGLGWLFDGKGVYANVNPDIGINGVYAGLQLGHGSLNSRVTGIHNDSGSMPGAYYFMGDFGSNSGFTSGLFAGLGHSWNSYYLGLEAGIEGSSVEWKHQRAPSGRNFGVEKKSGAGIGLRAGYKLRNGTLLYLSGSRIRTRFITDWTKGSNSTAYIDRDDKVYGDRIGIGADIPTSKSIFLRASYCHTDYESYNFITDHGNPDAMAFDNSESLFHLGLGVHF